MKIEPYFSRLPTIGEAPTPRMAPAPQTPSAPPAVDFGELISHAIQGAEHAQMAANTETEKLARGEGNLHEVALSLEKADISMRLLVKARNKIVEAYQEMMRMPV